MKFFPSICSAILLSTATLTFASERPQPPSENPNILFQIEVPGHLADGLDEILSIVDVNGSVSVVKAEGSYNPLSGNTNIDYKVTTLGSGLTCNIPESPERGDESILCSKDERYVDGPFIEFKIICNGVGFTCSAIKTVSWVDMLTGLPGSTTSTLLRNASIVR